MTDARRNDHPDPLRHSLDAANEFEITRTSWLPGRRPRHQQSAKYYTMASSTPITDIAPFGTYPGYLAARLGGLKTALGLSQYEV